MTEIIKKWPSCNTPAIITLLAAISTTTVNAEILRSSDATLSTDTMTLDTTLDSDIKISAEYERDTITKEYTPILKPEFFKLYSCQLPEASAAYNRECSEETATTYTYNTAYTINQTAETDPSRCTRRVSNYYGGNGNFKFDPTDNAFHQVGYPYLGCIEGSLIIKGHNILDELYLPRLQEVQGNVTLDFRHINDNPNPTLEYVDLPSLEEINQLTVHARSNNTDLNGLNAATTVDKISIYNDADDAGMLLTGLNGVTTLTTLVIHGGVIANYNELDGLFNTTKVEFLNNLTTLSGNLTLNAQNMPRIYGIGGITHVQGNVTITLPSNTNNSMTDLTGLGQLNQIGGTLNITNLDDLQSLEGLGYTSLNGLNIDDNPNLNDISALSNINIASNGHVSFTDNPNLSCTDINNFISSLPANINVNNPDC